MTEVFTSVRAALEAAPNLAQGQRIVVIGRPAHVESGTIRFDKGLVTTTSRPKDGRRFARAAKGGKAMLEEE